MILTEEERAILASVVVDPDKWVARALDVVGESVVVEKIEKYRANYLAKKDLSDYKTRAETQAILDKGLEQTQGQLDEMKIQMKMQEILRRQAIAEIGLEDKADVGIS